MTEDITHPKKPDPAAHEIRWRRISILADKQLLEELYLTEGSLNAVAEKTNSTRYQVYRAVKAHGIDIRILDLKRRGKHYRSHVRLTNSQP